DRVVVGPAGAAAQDHVAVRVAPRGDDRAEALLRHAQELVRVDGGAHGVDRDLHAAVGAVLEADRHREARGELAVHLALGRARADGAPRHEIRGELRRDRIQELAARRQPELREIEQQPARPPEPFVDREAPDAQVTRALRHRAQMYTRAADVSMASVPVRVRTRRRRGRRDTLPDAVDRLAVLERIQKKVLWLGTYTVHHANSLRASSDGIKVGGHQASSSSWWATRSSTRATSVRRWPRKLSRG